MKKLSLTVIGIYIGMLAAFSHNNPKADTAYKSRKLKLEEVNLVSSYYRQDGNNATVTGGIGSEKLTDISNTIDLTISKYDKKYRKHKLTLEFGIDHYTSASSDQIDPKTISSASSEDTRFYPSLGWTVENERKGTTWGAGISYSGEFDYSSIGANVTYSKKTNNRNGELTLKGQAFFDQVSLIYPEELRSGRGSLGSSSRTSFNGAVGWNQIINKRLQMSVDAEIVSQHGYLSLPFHRVYFNDNTAHIEKLPSQRLKFPIGLRASYFIGDKFIVRSWYRFYHDNWGINSNAVQLETVIKLTPFFSITPFYRFYQQTGSTYFAAYREHTNRDDYYTSNFALSAFNSQFFGAGIRIAPPKALIKAIRLQALELRYGHYDRTTNLNANIISLHLKFK